MSGIPVLMFPAQHVGPNKSPAVAQEGLIAIVRALGDRKSILRNCLLLYFSATVGCSLHSDLRRATFEKPGRTSPIVESDRDAAPGGPIKPMPEPPGRVFITDRAPLAPQDARSAFIVPPGFEVQLVASELEIQKPMQLAFDERGRLLVSTSTNYPLGPLPDGPPSDRVLLIEIDGESGAATDITVFADGFDICSGIEAMPGGRVILGHAPDILLLTDTDGDDVADAREVLYSGFARDDTHELPNSFTWGIDGWLYGLQGHVNRSNVKNSAGDVTAIHHGNVYRMQPDGSAIEVWAPGMSNPWGLAFDNNQNLFGADCESRPLWQIVEGFAYQGFLQPNEPLGFAPHVTEDSHGASGFAGLVSYTAEAFPPAYRDRLFLGNPVNGRIHLDRLEGTGSTKHLTREPDFLATSDPWFRPVDVELGPDGALYIADWYNRIIAHVEVPLDHPDRDKSRGRIWRIVYVGDDNAPLSDAATRQFLGPMAIDWSKASRRNLLRALSNRNQWIRRTAAAQLAHRFSDTRARAYRRIVSGNGSSTERAEALWLLERGDNLTTNDLETLLENPDPHLRRQATHMIGHQTSSDPLEVTRRNQLLISTLDDPSPFVVREAALSLRDVPTVESLNALTERSGGEFGGDTLRQYALRQSMREHLEQDDVLTASLKREMDADQSTALTKILAVTETTAAATALSKYLVDGRIPKRDRPQVLRTILVHGETQAIRRAFIDNPALSSSELAVYANALFTNSKRAENGGLIVHAILEDWFPRLTANDDKLLALKIGARYGLAGTKPVAIESLTDSSASLRAREVAAEYLLDSDFDESASRVLEIVQRKEESVWSRRQMARIVARYVDGQARFDGLLDTLRGAPSDVFAGAVESLSTRRPGVEYLLEAVEAKRISPSHINNHITRIRIESSHNDAELTARYLGLVEGVEGNDAEIRNTIARYRDIIQSDAARNIRNGQRVFEETCMKCHRMGGLGGMRGPNLDGIAARGIDRILQDVLMPNWDIDPAFQTTMIWLHDGTVVDGLVMKENETRLTIVNTQDVETEVLKDDIDERRSVWLSPMPSDLGAALEETMFLDLVYFLMNPPDTMELMSESATMANER